jgi:hypothetical protein
MERSGCAEGRVQDALGSSRKAGKFPYVAPPLLSSPLPSGPTSSVATAVPIDAALHPVASNSLWGLAAAQWSGVPHPMRELLSAIYLILIVVVILIQ